MLFVDGENLTIRAQKLAAKRGIDLADENCFPLYRKDTYFWPAGLFVNGVWWPERVHVAGRPERCYYYTSTHGDKDAIEDVHDKLAEVGFSPVVIHWPRNQKESKGVDISLTKDMLVHAFLGNYDVAVLVSGDGDYVPVVEELKRLGKWVIVAFFGKDDGLNSKLLRAPDQYYSLGLFHGQERTCRPLTAPPPKSQILFDIDPALKARLERLAKSRSPERKIGEEAVIAIRRYVEEEEGKAELPPLLAT
jgi:hypothetical protein